ncbi:MAG: hypothetical protein B6I24_05845 [Bacteroidetes bacterium 4572_128]|nr:MAG: hypothetical protein B6I24_05845 [Bacteroidetes bacterium 4572_128]
MKKDELKYIDEIVENSLQDFQLKGSEDEWKNLEKDLVRQNFLSVLKNFNIFYAGLIFLFSSFLVFIFLFDFKNENKNNLNVNAISAATNNFKINEKSIFPNKENFLKNENLLKKSSKNQKKFILKNENLLKKSSKNQKKFFLKNENLLKKSSKNQKNLFSDENNLDTTEIILKNKSSLNLSNWSLEIYYSPLYTPNILSVNSDISEDYIKYRKNSEKALISYSYGGNINYNFKNLTFQIGVSYTKLGEEFSKKIVKNKIDSTIIIVLDTFQIVKYDTNKITNFYNTTNEYNYFEIPLITSYNIKNKTTIFSMKMGIITGFFLNAKGQSISLKDINETIEINKYKLDFRTSIIIEPYIRQNINSIFKKNYEISQKYRSTGLKIGVKYYF